jgi:hypothetical protein
VSEAQYGCKYFLFLESIYGIIRVELLFVFAAGIFSYICRYLPDQLETEQDDINAYLFNELKYTSNNHGEKI